MTISPLRESQNIELFAPGKGNLGQTMPELDKRTD